MIAIFVLVTAIWIVWNWDFLTDDDDYHEL